MPRITIDEPSLRPRFPVSASTNSGYFSYVRLWSRQEQATIIPPTMREHSAAWRNVTRRLVNAPICIDGSTRDEFIHAIRSFSRDSFFHLRPNPSVAETFVAIQMGFNIVARYMEVIGSRTYYKIDYIQTVADALFLTHGRVLCKFNDRAVLRLRLSEYDSLRHHLISNNLGGFFEFIYSIYETVRYNYRLAHPRNRDNVPRRSNSLRVRRTSTPTPGTYIGGPVAPRPYQDAPNTPLAQEYTNRTIEADDSISPIELSTMILHTAISPEIRDQIYELIIRNHIGEEVQA